MEQPYSITAVLMFAVFAIGGLIYLAYFRPHLSEEVYLEVLTPLQWQTAEEVHEKLSAEKKIVHVRMFEVHMDLTRLASNGVILTDIPPHGSQRFKKHTNSHRKPLHEHEIVAAAAVA